MFTVSTKQGDKEMLRGKRGSLSSYSCKVAEKGGDQGACGPKAHLMSMVTKMVTFFSGVRVNFIHLQILLGENSFYSVLNSDELQHFTGDLPILLMTILSLSRLLKGGLPRPVTY